MQILKPPPGRRNEWLTMLSCPQHAFVAVVQLLSCVPLCDPMHCSMPGSPYFTVSWSLLRFTFIESVMLCNHLILCHRLLLLSSIFSSIRVFFNKSALCIQGPKYWNFSFSICLSNEYSRLISLGIDWFNVLAVQGTLESLLQHHSPKASVLQCSAFFYGPTFTPIHDYWENHSFDCMTIWTFVSKIMPVLFNTLSRFVIAFLPRRKHLLISWL